MSAPVVRPGEGTQFQVKIAGTFTTVGEVHEVTGPNVTVKAIPNACLTSTAMTTRPSKLPTPEKCTIKLWFDPNDTTGQGIFTGDVVTPGTIRDFKVIFVTGDVVPGNSTFSGFVTDFKPNGMKNEENVGADVDIQLTTVVTYTAGAAS